MKCISERGTTITTAFNSGGRGRWGKPFLYYAAVAFAGRKKRRPKTYMLSEETVNKNTSPTKSGKHAGTKAYFKPHSIL